MNDPLKTHQLIYTLGGVEGPFGTLFVSFKGQSCLLMFWCFCLGDPTIYSTTSVILLKGFFSTSFEAHPRIVDSIPLFPQRPCLHMGRRYGAFQKKQPHKLLSRGVFFLTHKISLVILPAPSEKVPPQTVVDDYS